MLSENQYLETVVIEHVFYRFFFSWFPSQRITGAVVPLTLGIPSGRLDLRKEEMQISLCLCALL